GEERLGVREREEEGAVDPMDADDVRVVVGQPRELRARPSYKEVRLIGAHADVAPTEAGDRGVEGEQALLVAGEILLVLARLRDTAAFRRGIVFDRAEEQAAQRRWQDFGAVPDVRESLLYFRVDARGRRLRVEVDGGAARRTTKVGCAPDQRDEEGERAAEAACTRGNATLRCRARGVWRRRKGTRGKAHDEPPSWVQGRIAPRPVARKDDRSCAGRSEGDLRYANFHPGRSPGQPGALAASR